MSFLPSAGVDNPFAEDDDVGETTPASTGPSAPTMAPPLVSSSVQAIAQTTDVAAARHESWAAGVKRPREDEGEEQDEERVVLQGQSVAEPPMQLPVSSYAFDEGDGSQEQDPQEAEEEGFGDATELNDIGPIVTDDGEAEDAYAAAEADDAPSTSANEAENPPLLSDGVGADNEEGQNDEDGDGEDDDGETIHAVALKLSELEAADYEASGRYSFELRMAEAEADTLTQFIKAQQAILDAAVANTAATTVRPTSGDGGGDDRDREASACPLAPLTEAKIVNAVRQDPRVAAGVQRLVLARAQLARLEARVGRLRALLGNPMSSSAPPETLPPETPQHHLLQQLKEADRSFLGRRSFHEFQQASSGEREELPANANEETLASAAFMKDVLRALPYVQQAEKRAGLKRLLINLGHLSRHSCQLYRYDVHLQERLQAADRLVESALLTAEEWALMAAQATYSRDMEHLCSTQTLQEHRTMELNRTLRHRLTALQSAMAALVISRVKGTRAAGSTPSRAGRAACELRAAAEEETARLAALHQSLVQQALFLRKQARDAAYGDSRFTGTHLDLLIDADGAVEREASGLGSDAEVKETGSVLTRQLMLDSHAKLKQLVDSVLSSSPTLAVEARSEPQRCEGNDLSALKLRMVQLQERIASGQLSIAATMAANARLAQEIQCVGHVADYSSEPEKAAQLASLLLMKLGLANPLCEGKGSGSNDEEGSSGDTAEAAEDTSLAAIARHVLAIFHERTSELLDITNKHLETVGDKWVKPEQSSRKALALALRLLALKDFTEFAEAVPSMAPPHTSSALVDTITSLEQDDLSRLGAGEGEDAAILAPVPMPPLTTDALQATFAETIGGRYKAAVPIWAATQQTCQTLREELSWYDQFAVEEVADLLTKAQGEKKALLQRTLDAGKQSKQANDEKQQAATLAAKLAALEEGQVPQLEDRVAALRNRLRDLQEEYQRDKAQYDLARQADEAERQRAEQQRLADEQAALVQQEEQAMLQAIEEEEPLANGTVDEETLGGDEALLGANETEASEGLRSPHADTDGKVNEETAAGQGSPEESEQERADEAVPDANADAGAAVDYADEEQEHENDEAILEPSVPTETGQPNDPSVDELRGDSLVQHGAEMATEEEPLADRWTPDDNSEPGEVPVAEEDNDEEGEGWAPDHTAENDTAALSHEGPPLPPPPSVLRENPFYSGFGFDEENE